MNQKSHWNSIYSKREIIQKESGFVREVLKLLNPNSNVLELGCGAGYDAAKLAVKNKVVALDFSNKVIEDAKKRIGHSKNLTFDVHDTSLPFGFENNTLDCVYARLSLHYFNDVTTRIVFSEIHRVLKPDGILAFLVKSTNDPLYGKGDRIENSMYELNGHIRHFFSKDYTKSLLKDKFEISKLEEGEEEFYGKKSAFIKVVAKKPKSSQSI